MNNLINEKVEVLVTFNPYTGEVFPHKIKWQGRVYRIKKIGMHYPLRQGRKLLHYFGVVTETNVSFKLRLDTENLHWTLEEAIDEFATN